MTPDGPRLGVAPSLSSLIPRPSVRWPVFDLREENAARSTSCQSESELAFDLEDLCFRFFFFFFSFFLFLCFSFFFLFLCFSLHSEELELLPSSSSEVESSSSCFNCCILISFSCLLFSRMMSYMGSSCALHHFDFLPQRHPKSSGWRVSQKFPGMLIAGYIRYTVFWLRLIFLDKPRRRFFITARIRLWS